MVVSKYFMFSPLYHKCGASSHQQNFSFRNLAEIIMIKWTWVSKSHLHCLVCGHVASVGPFGVASVLLRLCFVLSYSYSSVIPKPLLIANNLPGSSQAFFCFLFAPDKRLVVCCSAGFLLPRSCPC